MKNIVTVLFCLALAACDIAGSGKQAEVVDDSRLSQAQAEPANWMTHGGTYLEQRYNQLDSINTESVENLGLKWFYEFEDKRGLEATPLVIDGVIYTTSAWSRVHAFDAKSGAPLWHYDPEIAGEVAFKACCDVVNRGPAFYQGKVYVGALDGRLIAIDAKTGKEVWSTVTVDQTKSYTITGAPRVVKGNVIIGNSGGEYGVRGYVSAYDAETGEPVWRFYTVPPIPGAGPDGAASDPMIAAAQATWAGDWSELGGGGTVWDAIVYDEDYNQVLVGVGNGSPWPRSLRSEGQGDNLFISSVLALDADTGEYKWHYQGTPGEEWDFTQTQPIILATLEIDKEPRKVMMQAPKNGFFYVIDRSNGKLVSAENYVPQNWTTGIDLETGRPKVAPDARYVDDEVFVALPSGHGGHNWQPMAYHPDTGLVYIPAQEIALAYKASQPFEVRVGGWNLGVDLAVNAIPDDADEIAAIRSELNGFLIAWDPIKQQEAWRVDHLGPWNGGVLATAGGLVFQGNASGYLLAFDASTGRQVWSFDTRVGIIAPPVTYAVDGVQYIALMAGYGGGYGLAAPFTENAGFRPNGRLMVFALNESLNYEVLKPELAAAVVVDKVWDKADRDNGAQIYETTCGVCHGATARSSGIIPDLRRSPILASAEAWQAVVHDGVLKDRGMIGFSAYLSAEDIEDIRGYVAERAVQLHQHGN
ncbi:MAG: PQQ-dependent dehydrogenase, methanol/ethanol family [Porticoccaceae bacterium]|jgi:quinohemoprotein ethanol dehydrogenase|nr:PQQ-dependent dehydrogenase, methanol/ethanol family [Porticoccaceae bacterium]